MGIGRRIYLPNAWELEFEEDDEKEERQEASDTEE
jgi:hypothetical protein